MSLANQVCTSYEESHVEMAKITVKIHAMSHFNDCIRRSGLPWEYSTNMYEQMHTTLMKAGYRSSNKRQATPQIA
jgi:23S rRNA maturation-related 3'-5' exoribonuclease YhaM